MTVYVAFFSLSSPEDFLLFLHVRLSLMCNFLECSLSLPLSALRTFELWCKLSTRCADYLFGVGSMSSSEHSSLSLAGLQVRKEDMCIRRCFLQECPLCRWFGSIKMSENIKITIPLAQLKRKLLGDVEDDRNLADLRVEGRFRSKKHSLRLR